MFKYPSFEASSASGNQAMNVKVTITPEWKETYHFKDKIWVDGAQKWYLITSGIDSRLDEFLAQKDLSKYIKEVPDMSMKGYINKYGSVRMFFTGSLLKPDYWIECDSEIMEGNPRCNSSFMYKGNNRVQYSFRRKNLIQHHEAIKRNIEKKLNDFIQEKAK